MRTFYTTVFFCFSILSIYSCTEQSTEAKKKPKSIHLVEIIPAVKSDIGIVLTRTGSLRARREVKIFNQEEGRIIDLPFFEGDRIKTGVIVARLDDKLLRSQLHRAKATRHKADEDLKRTRNLYSKKLASDEQLAQTETNLEIAKADEEILATRIGYTVIRSPINGVINARLSEPGNIAIRNSHLLTISDPSSLITEVTVSELIIPQIKIGDNAKVRIDALGDQSFTGKIIRIHPNLDPVSRRGTLEVELKPVPPGAQPGQLCRVQFDTQTKKRLVIPFRALRQDDNGEYVFTVNDQNQVKRITIVSGHRVAEQIEILDGLDENQAVVTKGFLGLKEGKKVNVVKSSDPTANTTLPGSGITLQ